MGRQYIFLGLQTRNWQAVIFGDNDAYLNRILAAGFDGVYLDIIDAYEYFEGRE